MSGAREAAVRLVLAPASSRGWFGGQALEATDPVEVRGDVTIAEAAAALEAAFEGSGDGLTAVLARYDGSCSVVRFARTAQGPLRPAATPDARQPLLADAMWDLGGRAFRARVDEIRERIAVGDVYVVNLTARLTGRLTSASPAEAFADLTRRAPADMAALFEGVPGAVPWIASVSPERFVRVRRETVSLDAARIVEIQPIKGTRPRGATPQADTALARELAENAKERAEHVMVVDLERNDLGACCVPGTVTVEPLYEVVSTPYCHQLVSTVRGHLATGASFATLLSAVFPCGSVTGAPKIAAMRIIDELEATERGAYCGALLVAVPGELDSAVLIRTLEGVGGSEDAARYGSGCGITFESDVAAEHLELLLKASPVTGDGVPEVGLRETMRARGGSVPLLDRHLARLAAGGAGPSVLARVREAVARELRELGAGNAAVRVGVTVTPDGSVAVGHTTEPSSLAVAGGPVVALVEVAHAPDLPLGAAKPAARRFWDRAHRAAELTGADQAVLHTPDGGLVDGSTSTVWLVRDGVMRTPPSPPAVAGVARELVFDAARRLDIDASEAALTCADLDVADEVWLSNAVGGFVPVRGRSGEAGARVADAVDDAFGKRRS